MTPDCVLTKLREGTHQQHQDIEGVIPVMKPTLTRDEYVEILKKFFCFYQVFESELTNPDSAQATTLRQMVPDLSERLKMTLLQKDLEFFGETSETTSGTTIKKPLLGETSYAAFGALYVMEGSSLGGQVISRHLQSHLGLTAQQGASFYNAYGSATGKMWQTFKSYLKAHVQSESAIAEAVAGAQATFTALKDSMADQV
jgi:heme oxygenase